ncbi:TPM domain-containing protein, partial [Variovorax boronicumulans]|uniref:TPM domain-containing protein n=1 Tax=Variovorax boronicumulans TaxID=436515 RepID=UPI000AF828F3
MNAPMRVPLSMPRWLSLCLGLLLVLCLAGPRAAQAKPVPVPPMSSRVVDLAQALPAGEAEALRAQIADIQSRTQAQLAVLIVPTTGEDTIENYATRVFTKWRLGRSDADDGILLLVAQKDRRMRIEVGTGLEGTVTDIQAARIIDREMAPRFREGDFAGGVQAAVGALARLLDGEVGVVAPESQQIAVDHAAAPDEEKVTSLTRGGHVTPEGWGLLGVVLWGLGLGIYHGRGIERDPPRGSSASRRAEEKKRKGKHKGSTRPEPWADALAAIEPEPARARPAP